MADPPRSESDDQPVEPAEVEISGAEQLAARLALSPRLSPRPTDLERERFVSLVSYHYGKGTVGSDEFGQLIEKVQAAATLQELYELTSGLSWPVPLVDRRPAKRKWWRA